jgi:hypothetical protein
MVTSLLTGCPLLINHYRSTPYSSAYFPHWKMKSQLTVNLAYTLAYTRDVTTHSDRLHIENSMDIRDQTIFPLKQFFLRMSDALEAAKEIINSDRPNLSR